MRIKTLKAKYALIALSVFFSCTLTSCLEDEKNPFEQENEVYAMLPGDTQIYPGAEVELRGEGFTSSDKIYIAEHYDDDDMLTEARVTRVTNDRLFFIMSVAFQDSHVYVVIQRDGTNTLLGSLQVHSYFIVSELVDLYYNVYIEGPMSDDCKVYLQELDDNGEPIGESTEIELLEHSENYCVALAYPTTRLYTITLEQNGEVAATQILDTDRDYASYQQYECSRGGTVNLLWGGFIDTDKIVLFDGYNEIEVDCTIYDGTAYFVVPETLEPWWNCSIMLKRYENYDYFNLGNLIVFD